MSDENNIIDFTKKFVEKNEKVNMDSQNQAAIDNTPLKNIEDSISYKIGYYGTYVLFICLLISVVKCTVG